MEILLLSLKSSTLLAKLVTCFIRDWVSCPNVFLEGMITQKKKWIKRQQRSTMCLISLIIFHKPNYRSLMETLQIQILTMPNALNEVLYLKNYCLGPVKSLFSQVGVSLSRIAKTMECAKESTTKKYIEWSTNSTWVHPREASQPTHTCEQEGIQTRLTNYPTTNFHVWSSKNRINWHKSTCSQTNSKTKGITPRLEQIIIK